MAASQVDLKLMAQIAIFVWPSFAHCEIKKEGNLPLLDLPASPQVATRSAVTTDNPAIVYL